MQRLPHSYVLHYNAQLSCAPGSHSAAYAHTRQPLGHSTTHNKEPVSSHSSYVPHSRQAGLLVPHHTSTAPALEHTLKPPPTVMQTTQAADAAA